MIIEDFTRKETLELTKVTSNQLQSFQRSKLVTPKRIVEFDDRPFYSWNHLLEIRSIRKLKANFSVETIRLIFDLMESSPDATLLEKQIVVVNGHPSWLAFDWSDLYQALFASDRALFEPGFKAYTYNLLVIPPPVELIDEIWKVAKQSTIVNFESFKWRAKHQPQAKIHKRVCIAQQECKTRSI